MTAPNPIARPRRAFGRRLGTLLALALVAGLAAAPAAAQTRIVATVNDEPISEFDVDQRTEFYFLTGGGKVSKKVLRERAMKELVDEVLMSQEMRRLAITVPDSAVIEAINDRLKGNKRDYAWFKGILGSRGIRIQTLENRLRAQLGWRQVVQRTYAGLINIGENEITKAIKEIDAQDEKPDTVFNLQKIVLALPKGADDAAIARRMEDATKIRRAFRDCRTSSLVTGRFRDVKTIDAQRVRADQMTEPTRSLVLQANTNDMIPPNVVDDAIVLVAVCARTDDGGRREKVQEQLVSQEFSMLADRHLRDLQQDAIIDYR